MLQIRRVLRSQIFESTRMLSFNRRQPSLTNQSKNDDCYPSAKQRAKYKITSGLPERRHLDGTENKASARRELDHRCFPRKPTTNGHLHTAESISAQWAIQAARHTETERNICFSFCVGMVLCIKMR
jgi:hypothetical protein